MRHGKKVKKLGRTHSHRVALMANMAISLIQHKRITTTLQKAKALRVYVEPLITKSKTDTTHSRRTVFAYLKDKETVGMLFRDISEKVADRPGGYTRIVKLTNRLGDNAEMAMIELVDYNEVYTKGTATPEKKTTRRRAGGKKKATEAVAAEAVDTEATEVVEEVAEETTEKEATTKKETPEAKTTEEKSDDTPKEGSAE